MVSLPFDAANVERLEVLGLAEYGIPDLEIPDPSNKQVRALGRFVARTAGGVRSGDIARMYAEAIASADGDAEKADAACDALDAETYDIIAMVCSQKITTAQLAALPHRMFREFSYWLISKLLDHQVTNPSSAPLGLAVASANGR